MRVLIYIASLTSHYHLYIHIYVCEQDGRLLITDQDNGAGIGISNWLHKQLHHLKAYFRELCVHEIIVDHNKEKDAAATSNTTGTKDIDVDNGHNSDPLVSTTTTTTTTTTTNSSSLEESFKKAVLSTPGVEGLNSQLCFKLKSDQVYTSYSYTVRYPLCVI